MYLSDEQMNVVSGSCVGTWRSIVRPTGRQELPVWLAGAHVDWMNGCANAPQVKLKVRGDVFAWENERWSKADGACYIARHSDGRARVLYHAGAISEAAAWRVYGKDHPLTYKWIVPETRRPGESWVQAAQREGEAHIATCRSLHPDERPIESIYGEQVTRADLHVVVKPVRVTTQQSGFGGDSYLLPMDDGSEVLLRGPWHGGAPNGYVEVSAYDCHETPIAYLKNQPWFKRGGRGGLYLTEDLFIRIMATHAAHVELARVQHSYGERVEPFRAEWQKPKAAIYDLEWGRAGRKEPAGTFWKVYWDHSERYCGSPCPDTPPHGLLAA